MNRTVDPSAAEQRAVRRIDDRVECERRDIGHQHLEQVYGSARRIYDATYDQALAEIEADAMSIPQQLTVSIEGVEEGTQILAGSVELPNGVTLISDPEMLVVNIVAAPTAGLHFDEPMLDALRAHGVVIASVTLHVGAGTFQPMKTEKIADHVMHHERYAIPAVTLEAIAACKARGGRLVAVGTTTVRTLETYAKTKQQSGDTNIFITPGFKFQMVDLLLTNFHLPKSTLMMLVSAFAGYERVMSLYAHAIQNKYRFFSYGDAMLLARQA